MFGKLGFFGQCAATIMGGIGGLATAIITFGAWSGAANQTDYTMNDADGNLEFSLTQDRTVSYVVYASSHTKKTTIKPARGEICKDSVDTRMIAFFPLVHISDACRPLAETDLPLLKDFAKAVNYTKDIEAKFTPMITATVSANPKP